MEMNSRQRTNFLVLTFQRQEGIEGLYMVCTRFIFGQVHACFDHFVIIVIQTIQKRRQTTTDTSFIE